MFEEKEKMENPCEWVVSAVFTDVIFWPFFMILEVFDLITSSLVFAALAGYIYIYIYTYVVINLDTYSIRRR